MRYRHTGGASGRWFFSVATWPFGILEVDKARLRIGVQYIGPIASLLGIRDMLTVTKRDTVGVRQGGSGIGAGFFIVDQFESRLSAVFNTLGGETVRRHLEECGWPRLVATGSGWQTTRD